VKNNITFRKTPHAKRTRNTVFGEETYIETRDAWTFLEDGNFDSEVVWATVSVAHCFVKDGCQEIPDGELRPTDMRSCTVDVFTARQANMERGFGWKTNWEFLNPKPAKQQEPTATLEFFI
jgi:hypothetical protein